MTSEALASFGRMELDTLDGVSCLTWKIGLDEDLNQSIRAHLLAIWAAYESQFGRSNLTTKILAWFSPPPVVGSEWHRIRSYQLTDLEGKNIREVRFYVTGGVVPRVDPTGEEPIKGCPGLQIQIRVTRVGL
jgi:hypothetical protein